MIRDIYLTLKTHRNPLLLLCTTWGLYFTLLYSRLLEWTSEGLYGGHTNIWSDWSAHIGMANIFAYKDPQDWLAYHPYFSAGKFTYPFLTNLISGLLIRCGVPLVPSMVAPSILYSFLLLSGLYFLLHTLLKSRRQAVLAIFLFLLSSGPGFLIYLKDLVQHFKWSSLFYPPLDYSALTPWQWYAGNVIEGLIAPQRAFLLGMTLASWALYGFFRGLLIFEERSKRVGQPSALAARYWVVTSVLIGLLPFTHAHTFLAITPGVAVVVLYQLFRSPSTWRQYLYLVLPAAALGLFYYLFILRGGVQSSHFQSWSPGWTSHGGFLGWLSLWVKIWGLALPVAVWGFVQYLRQDHPVSFKLFIGSFFFLFALGNLIFFQPSAWDNSKIFFWCYLIFCGLMANRLGMLLTHRRRGVNALGVLLLISFTATGLMEVYRMQWMSKNRALMTNTDDIELGRQIRERTGPREVFLTAPTHNHFVMMWGVRPILLGYTAWAWNYGFLYQEAEQDMKTMYLGGGGTPALLAKQHIHYVVIGEEELRTLHADELYFARNYRLAFANKNYRIYDVSLKD